MGDINIGRDVNVDVVAGIDRERKTEICLPRNIFSPTSTSEMYIEKKINKEKNQCTSRSS